MRKIIPYRSLAHRYALALWVVTVENNQTEEVYHDMLLILKVAGENPEFRKVIVSQVVSTSKKIQIIKAIFEGKLSKLTLSFSELIISKNRQQIALSIAEEYISIYKQANKLVDFTLRSAVPIPPELKARLIEKFSQKLQGEVMISEEIDPDLIGGFQVEFEDYLYDASVKSELEKFSKELHINLFEKQY